MAGCVTVERFARLHAGSSEGVKVRARIVAWWTVVIWIFSGLPASAEESARGLLWEVVSPRTTVYLLGTIHVGTADLYPLPPAIEKAYDAATVLAVEADLSATDSIGGATAAAMYRPPDNLERHVPAQLFRDVGDILRAYGLPPELGRIMKPHMLSMTLTMIEGARSGLDPGLGIDLHLVQRAHRDGKRVLELESVAGQIAMLESMPEDVQVAMLQAAIDGIRAGTLGSEMMALLEAWKSGDAGELEQVAMRDLEEMPPHIADTLKQVLYDDRNATMADRVAAFLEGPDVVLVAVGAGHMIGDDGVVARLAARGFKVRQH